LQYGGCFEVSTLFYLKRGFKYILLLIELNDSSHNDIQRRKRDIKVREICEKAGIRIITFYTNRLMMRNL